MTRGWLYIVLLGVLVPAIASPQDDGQVRIKERELEEVRERISALKEQMDRRAAERESLAGELEAAEVRISETRIHLGELEKQERYAEEKLAKLATEIGAAEAALAEESARLADQVRAAWMGGSQERVRLLLNQQDPATLGRLLVYYRYLSAYRSGNIATVTAQLERLARLHGDAAAERDRLAALSREREAELAELAAAQERRQALLASVKERMAEAGAEIERLAAQEADLSRLIAELTAILSDYPITSDQPFAALKGRLTWPVAGQLLHDFGQPRANGRLKWNGVVLAAPRGREVRSVYHGRVIFADWLDGMGLLVIVNHGDGYLTLYGHNETTLKSAGDWVAPGDVIATVGASGGQPRASLYFEIRRNARPVDPRAWFSRQPSG